MARHVIRFRSLMAASLVAGAALAGCGQNPEPEQPVPPSEEPDRYLGVTETLPPAPAPATPQPPPRPSLPVDVYSFDLPKEYPLAAASWRANLPLGFQDFAWAAEFEGVGSPLRPVTLNGQQMLFGFLCEPHNCGFNNIGFLITPDQSRVIGFVQITDERSGAVSITPVGGPSRDEQACLMKLHGDLEAATC